MSDNRDELIAALEELVQDLLSEVDWSSGRSDYGDNFGYLHAADRISNLIDEFK